MLFIKLSSPVQVHQITNFIYSNNLTSSMDTTPLKETGMTDGEIKVYLALAELGLSTVGPILDESQITKSMIYRILEKLIKKGLVSFILKEKTKHYQITSPERLLDYVEERKKVLDTNKEKIQKIIPQLLVKKSLSNKSQATIYEGFKGLMSAYENRYNKLIKGDEVILYGLPAEQPGFHHAFWKKNHQLLAKKGINCRMLYHPDVSNATLKDRNSYKGCTVKKMPFTADMPSWVMIYKDVTLIAIPQGIVPLAIEIENQDVANSFKVYFEWLWKQAK